MLAGKVTLFRRVHLQIAARILSEFPGRNGYVDR